MPNVSNEEKMIKYLSAILFLSSSCFAGEIEYSGGNWFTQDIIIDGNPAFTALTLSEGIILQVMFSRGLQCKTTITISSNQKTNGNSFIKDKDCSYMFSDKQKKTEHISAKCDFQSTESMVLIHLAESTSNEKSSNIRKKLMTNESVESFFMFNPLTTHSLKGASNAITRQFNKCISNNTQ